MGLVFGSGDFIGGAFDPAAGAAAAFAFLAGFDIKGLALVMPEFTDGDAFAGNLRGHVATGIGGEVLRLELPGSAGGPGRDGIVRAARATRDRPSPLGAYSLDEDGLTTTPAYGLMRIVDCQLVWA